ncbi:MAG TPA: acyl-CoA dehydrogenase family protein [Burkholderiales bacterium]|nr:acyl-CoA dehydrogenase family protein [Burkholderiales bacterium]
MNFDYNEEQQLLADSVRRYLQKDYDFEARKKILASAEGWSEPVWSTFAEMGLTGLPLSPDYGGFGGGAVDLMSVMEAFGEALVVEPYLPTVLAALAIAKGGEARQKQEILPLVAQGKMRLALATGPRGVIGAPMADRIVFGSEGRLRIVARDAIEVRAYRTVDDLAAGDIRLEGKGEPLAGGVLDEVLDFGAALSCAEAVGAMKFACDTTLEYLKTRRQFGVPIGAFQALQHRMVDMFMSYEQAKSMACLACSKVDQAESARDRARSVSAARIRIADAARHISQESVQLHGGMGMSEELKVSHTFRRLTALGRRFGDADHHLARFASL